MKYPGVQKLIDVLKVVDNSEKSQMGFDMLYWYGSRSSSNHPCGTACCIAGWAQACRLQQDPTATIYDEPLDGMIKFCELSDSFNIDENRRVNPERETLWELVAPEYVSLKTLTLPMAIRVLEIFRDTGEVQWREVYNEMRGDDANVSSVP